MPRVTHDPAARPAVAQRLLTIQPGRIMQTFIEQQSAGYRIVTMAPHYNHAAILIGYLVVVEPGVVDAGTDEADS